MARILIVDDDKGIREILEIALSQEGYDVVSAPDGMKALARCRNTRFDLIITDLKMPKMDGIEFMKALKEISPESLIILMTAYASKESALQAMHEGAYDYLEKTFDIDHLKTLVRDALKKRGIKKGDLEFLNEIKESASFMGMIGKSRNMQKVFETIRKVSSTMTHVMISGESGTGKELVARAVHDSSPQVNRPFVAINCGGIPENLLESELFGYMKGSFTGAHADKPGLFEVGHRGTIFLDEIAELPPMLQVKLLRAVQQKSFRRIGGTEDIKIDARIISATNKNLLEGVKNNTFREDLYYRLNVVPINVPPLRERQEDIPLITKFLIQKYSKAFGKEIRNISPYAMELLMTYPFPGNVRELENIIERSIAMESSNIILPENLILNSDLPTAEHTFSQLDIPDKGFDLNHELEKLEKVLIEKALQKTGGSRKKTADLLGVTIDSLHYRMDKLNIH
ncbi:MAG: sigma-54 dependent transcriptional regulator [Syntrophobacterales bacterium]|jgi:two-component system response regulator PilR (NtrC family)|nr:sigma-54 dependent transcriptional regulator [Syntrophobacterales bacterium]